MEELKKRILKEIDSIRKEKAYTIEHGIRLSTRIQALHDVLNMIAELEKTK